MKRPALLCCSRSGGLSDAYGAITLHTDTHTHVASSPAATRMLVTQCLQESHDGFFGQNRSRRQLGRKGGAAFHEANKKPVTSHTHAPQHTSYARYVVGGVNEQGGRKVKFFVVVVVFVPSLLEHARELGSPTTGPPPPPRYKLFIISVTATNRVQPASANL